MFHHHDSSPVSPNLVMLTLHIPMSSLSPHITVDPPPDGFMADVSQVKYPRIKEAGLRKSLGLLVQQSLHHVSNFAEKVCFAGNYLVNLYYELILMELIVKQKFYNFQGILSKLTIWMLILLVYCIYVCIYIIYISIYCNIYCYIQTHLQNKKLYMCIYL